MDKHEHNWQLATKTIPLHNYVTENGKITKDLITGKDTLKLWYCKCGAKVGIDLKRSKGGMA